MEGALEVRTDPNKGSHSGSPLGKKTLIDLANRPGTLVGVRFPRQFNLESGYTDQRLTGNVLRANDFIFMSYEADVLPEITEFVADLLSRKTNGPRGHHLSGSFLPAMCQAQFVVALQISPELGADAEKVGEARRCLP